MAILIKNLSVPADCSSCCFFEEHYDQFSGLFSSRCCANAFEVDDIVPEEIERWDWISEKRHPNCPIVEV